MKPLQRPTRLRNLVRRLARGEHFFSCLAPRMTRAEAEALNGLGLWMQSEAVGGANADEGREYYAFDLLTFQAKARELGLL